MSTFFYIPRLNQINSHISGSGFGPVLLRQGQRHQDLLRRRPQPAAAANYQQEDERRRLPRPLHGGSGVPRGGAELLLNRGGGSGKIQKKV